MRPALHGGPPIRWNLFPVPLSGKLQPGDRHRHWMRTHLQQPVASADQSEEKMAPSLRVLNPASEAGRGTSGSISTQAAVDRSTVWVAFVRSACYGPSHRGMTDEELPERQAARALALQRWKKIRGLARGCLMGIRAIFISGNSQERLTKWRRDSRGTGTGRVI